jgi:hypothetical protein
MTNSSVKDCVVIARPFSAIENVELDHLGVERIRYSFIFIHDGCPAIRVDLMRGKPSRPRIRADLDLAWNIPFQRPPDPTVLGRRGRNTRGLPGFCL